LLPEGTALLLPPHQPKAGFKYELDFVRVAVDGPLRLFAAYGGTDEGGRGSGFGVSPGFGVGMGGGGGFGGVSGGISIPIGGGGGSRGSSKIVYFLWRQYSR